MKQHFILHLVVSVLVSLCGHRWERTCATTHVNKRSPHYGQEPFRAVSSWHQPPAPRLAHPAERREEEAELADAADQTEVGGDWTTEACLLYLELHAVCEKGLVDSEMM